MSDSAKTVYLSPETEAERLWEGARDAFSRADESIVDLSEAVDLGVRVVEIVTGLCLQAVRDEFPASITSLLEPPQPDVDPDRDFLHPPRSLRFIDAVDMLSETDLPCVSRDLHHGWEDRSVSCQRSRERTFRATGIALSDAQRRDLMVIGAYRNRIFALPPPVRIVPYELMSNFPALTDLVERLFAAARSPAS